MNLPSERPADLTPLQKWTILIVSFLGWMFAGFQIALFVLIHRSAMLSLLPESSSEGANANLEDSIKQWFAWYQAAFLLGAASGGWIFGVVGDRYGRTRSLGLSILCYSVFTGACYFARSPLELLILRFLACHGVGGAWPNTVALIAEAWPAASRPFLAGVLGTAANIGQVLMGTLGLGFNVTPSSWRWTLLAGAAPFVLGTLCLTSVPESVRWQAARRKQSINSKGPIAELFRPPLRNRILMGILLGAIPVIGTAANAQWIVPWTDQVQSQLQKQVNAEPPTGPAGQTQPQGKADPKSKARAMISRSGGAVLGSLLGGILATMLGRRTTYFLISLLTLVASTWIFGWLHPQHPWFLWASFLFGLIGTVYFGWLPLYLPELFPTHVRATGTGISFNTGRVVAAFVVLCTGVLLRLFGGDYARIGCWTGMIYAAGMVIVLFAPRTDGGSLKE
jgi:SHS family sialic acid transporter-like MFS transporter